MRVKEAMVAGGYAMPAAAFAEWFPAPTTEQVPVEQEPEDVVYDYSDVEWRMPSQEDPTETLRLLAEMSRSAALTLDEDDEGGLVELADLPFFDQALTETDREWT